VDAEWKICSQGVGSFFTNAAFTFPLLKILHENSRFFYTNIIERAFSRHFQNI